MPNTVNIYVNKTDLGLNNVDNTSDLNKPISTATQTALNGKVDKNSAITGATKTKITYDSKGLVTAGADATTADITEVTDKRYVTDAQLMLIGNTSGVNTGNETNATIKTKLGAATSSNDGYLTSTDWSTFNGKQNALGFTPENFSNKSTNTNLGTSDTLYPSQKAVKTYVDTAVSGAAVPTLQQVTSSGSVTNTPITVANPTFSSGITPSEISTQRLATSKRVAIQADGEVIINTNGNFDGSIKATNLTQPITLEFPNKTAGTYTIATIDMKGAANGLAELDGTGKVPSSQLPSFVDDVVDYATLSAFPVTGESGKIYVALDTNLTYRWSGSVYVEISPSLALGETSSSAYRGDRGKIAYDHSLLTSGNPHNVTKTDVGLSNVPNLDATNPANLVQTATYRLVSDTEKSTWNGKENAITAGTTSQYYRGDKTFQTLDKTAVGLGNCDNTSDVNKPISSATQTALDNKSDKNITLDRKTASYTLVANDNGKMIEMNVASANTLTINASLFSAGNQILISQYGAGQTTITAGAGVTLRSSGGKLKTSAQYSLVTIIAISSTEFYIAGDLTA